MAGRPTGWSPVTGWTRAGKRLYESKQRQNMRADIEALCCAQVERIERTLARRYGRDYDGQAQTVGETVPRNKYHVMPANDHMTRPLVMRDATVETRR